MYIQTLSERNEIASLKDDNDNLHAEVEKYKEALTSATCPNCGGPASPGEMSFDEHHLRMEITRLREEVYTPLPQKIIVYYKYLSYL